jgi:hypothetical protein
LFSCLSSCKNIFLKYYIFSKSEKKIIYVKINISKFQFDLGMHVNVLILLSEIQKKTGTEFVSYWIVGRNLGTQDGSLRRQYGEV